MKTCIEVELGMEILEVDIEVNEPAQSFAVLSYTIKQWQKGTAGEEMMRAIIDDLDPTFRSIGRLVVEALQHGALHNFRNLTQAKNHKRASHDN